MGNWGVSENATPKEKLKSEMADFLNGLNSTGEINISTYEEFFDFSMDLLDKMYDLGCANAKTSTHKQKCMACYGSGCMTIVMKKAIQFHVVLVMELDMKINHTLQVYNEGVILC